MALSFKANSRQWADLLGLAYWVADAAYCRELMTRAEYEREEQKRHDGAITSLFDSLDRLGVPYWVQNAVICWAEDWRREASEYMDCGLRRRGYDITRGCV